MALKRNTLAFAVGAMAFVIGGVVYAIQSSRAVLPVVPYAATHRISDPKTGKHVAFVHEVVRSDGSRVERPTSDETYLWDIPNRLEVNINSTARVVLKTPMLRHRVPQFSARNSNCEAYFSNVDRTPGAKWPQVTCLETGNTKFGYPTIAVTLVMAPELDGRSGMTKLDVIKELGWLAVHREDRSSYDGHTTFVSDVIELRVGEPPAAEFLIPSDYRVMPNFVEFAKEYRASRHEPIDAAEITEMQKKWDNVISAAKAGGDFRFK